MDRIKWKEVFTMKQILQNLKTGKTELTEVPRPDSQNGQLLIQTHNSLISAGTERMLVEFSKASLIGKAKSQPDKVKLVLDKIKSDGLLPTLESVFNRLDEPLPLGYCNAGVVLESESQSAVRGLRSVSRGQKPEARDQRSETRNQKSEGEKEEGLHAPCALPHAFKPGDRVVSNGPHAEVVSVPYNLCAKIPDEVTDEQAAFTVLGSIALQGIRLMHPQLGDKIVVYGLGLVGLLTIQMLQANGCEVMGIDVNNDRIKLAEKYGIMTVNPAQGSDPVSAANSWTQGKGVDGVLITAATKTNEIMHNSAEICRKRGTIILVGSVGLNLRRSDFYEKELTFQVSCSYGPGRYDDTYEQKGQDYPYGFVRWTEQRNFLAVLEMMKKGQLNVEPLITHRFDLADAPKAYEQISKDPHTLGVILNYPETVDLSQKITLPETKSSKTKKVCIGVIGAGNFTKVVLMPALAKTNARIAYVASQGGVSAQHLIKKFGIEHAVTDYSAILNDDQVNTVVITLRHHMHAKVLTEALKADKHVFVEKPLALNEQEIDGIIKTVKEHPDQQVMVGFNRRFSPHIKKMKSLLQGRSEPLAMHMTVNAGIIPPDHWAHDPVQGGGRIIGEGCHFIDLLLYLADSTITHVSAVMMGKGAVTQEDKMAIQLLFEDGSIGTINYYANGPKSYPKEMLEVFSEGRVLRMDNFKKLSGWGFKKFKKMKTNRQDKGHSAELNAFIHRIEEGGAWLIPLDQLVNVTRASFAAVSSARERKFIKI